MITEYHSFMGPSPAAIVSAPLSSSRLNLCEVQTKVSGSQLLVTSCYTLGPSAGSDFEE